MNEVKFVRIKGRIVPIKKKKHKKDYKGLAIGAAGIGFSVLAASKIANIATSKFGKKAGIASLLGSIFAGEAIASEGIDRYSESLGMSKRSEQNIKNVMGGSIGVIGALSTIGTGKIKYKAIKRLLK